MANKKSVAVQVGSSISLMAPSKLQVPRVTVSDPTVAMASAVSPTTIRFTGKKTGSTTVSLWDQNGVRTDYSVTVKPSQNFSFFVGLTR